MKRNNNRGKNRMRGKQGSKDSNDKRINLDNERLSKAVKDIAQTFASNDVRWYANNPELLRSAASLSFSQTTGAPLNFYAAEDVTGAVPGIQAFYFYPSIGGGDTDAINASKESVYSFVVHANSRNTSYTSSDLMLVILAGMQVFTCISAGIRAYGLMRLFDQRTKYLPESLISALGFNYKDLQSNLSKMWFDLNEVIARASQIWIPNEFPVLDRWFWMNQHVYMDSETVKGQYYLYAQRRYYIYNETLNSQGGGLEWVTLSGVGQSKASGAAPADFSVGNITWSQYMTMLNGMISALLNSEDRGIIMGDVLKAYGADRIYALKPIDVNYNVIPVYDKEVLTQIENMTIAESNWVQIVQNQSNLRLEQQLILQGSSFSFTPDYQLPQQAILNFHQKEIPTPEQIMVATRLIAMGHQFSSNVKIPPLKINAMGPAIVGTELVSCWKIYTYLNSGELNVVSQSQRFTSDTTLSLGVFKRIMSFDWCPWLYLVNQGAVTEPTAAQYNDPGVIVAAGDYDYYTIIDAVTLKKMHTTALYSEWGVPTLS